MRWYRRRQRWQTAITWVFSAVFLGVLLGGGLAKVKSASSTSKQASFTPPGSTPPATSRPRGSVVPANSCSAASADLTAAIQPILEGATTVDATGDSSAYV